MNQFLPKLVDRLIGKSVLLGMFLAWAVFIGLDTFSAFANELDEIGKNGYSFSAAVTYVALTIPRRTHEHFSTIAVIGTLLGLGGLAPTGELTALRAAGLSKWRIAKSVMGSIFVLTMLSLLIGETIAPAAEARAQALEAGIKSANLITSGATGIWAREGESLLNAKVGRVDGQKLMLDDVRIFDFTANGQLQQITRAKSGSHDGERWRLQAVKRFVFESDGVTTTQIDQEIWKSQLDPKLLALSLLKPAYLSSRDLVEKIRYLKRNQLDPREHQAALWSRVFFPPTAILLALSVVPFAFGTLRSGGFGKRLFIGIVVALGYYFAVTQGLVKTASAFHFDHRLALALPLIPLLVWVIFYFRKST